MRGNGKRPYLIGAIVTTVAVFGGLAVFAATKAVDLDGKTANGAESSCSLTVLTTFPAKVESKITNKAVGDSFSFVWPSAALGGFSSTLAPGTTTGVGTKLVWTTSQTIYAYTGNACGSDICFTKTAGPDPVTSRGPFGVPGRSLTTSGVTLSNASLTSSLLSFFSPQKLLFSIDSSVGQTALGSLGYNTQVTSKFPNAVTFNSPAYPPGCCNDVHQLNCSDECVYYLTDPLNCGACGNVCGAGSHCSEGTCVTLCPVGTTLCGDTCVDLQNDPANCGSCGHACGDNQICTTGACVTCTPPAQTACDNRCVNVHTDAENCGSCGVNCNALCPSTGQGACSQGNSCTCIEGTARTAVPFAGVVEAPLCETQAIEQTLLPGGTFKQCQNSAVLAKEVANTFTVCDGGNPPGPSGLCDNGLPPTQGSYLELLPDFTKAIPPVFLSPTAVILTEPSGDGLAQPGESVNARFSLVNAGSQPLTGVTAQLSSPPVDLTDDGVANPVGVVISGTSQPFPNIPGAPAGGGDCTQAPPPINPSTNSVPFTINLPVSHPGDTSRPFNLHFIGNTTTGPIALDVPITLGISGKCDPADIQGNYDGVQGLDSPMAKLVPEGDPVPFPPKPFAQGKSRPMKLKLLCGGVTLTGSQADQPQIVGLSEATHGPIDITKINLNDGANPFDPLFSYSASGQLWNYTLRTKDLAKGTYVITIRLGNRKDYVTGFVLN
jgi:hypothetical protein